MASEITGTTNIQVTNGTLSMPKMGKSFRDDQAVKGANNSVLSIATAGEDVPLGDIATPGWVQLKNLNGANFVQFGPKIGGTFYPIGRLLPGLPNQFMLDAGVVPSTTTLHLKADTAACLVRVTVLSR